MKNFTSQLRTAALCGLVVLFVLTAFFFHFDRRVFTIAAILATSFGLLGVLLVMLTLRIQEPRSHRVLFLITGISAALIPISVVLHNLVYVLCIELFGKEFLKDGSDEPFFLILAIVVCPVLFVIGAVSSAALLLTSEVKQAGSG
jgi:uncharacterized membrane protein HdeD (DUF308 family)